MRRPLVWVTIPALVAVFGVVAECKWCIPLCLIALVLATSFEYYQSGSEITFAKVLRYVIPNMLVSVLVCLGTFLYATDSVSLQNKFPINELNKAVHIKGTVESVTVKEYGVVLIMTDSTVNDFEDLKLLVNVYDDQWHTLASGDYIELTGKVETISKPRNEGEFNAQMYYNSLGIFYKAAADNILSVEKATGVKAWMNMFKERLNSVFEMVADNTDSGILKAVVLGDKDYLDEEVYELYKKNGIAHILAISGLHISFIGMMLYKFFKHIFSGYIVPFGTTMSVLLLYAVMTGNSVSAKRAVIMCLVSMGADVLGRTYDALSALSLSALLIVWENVFIIYNSAFQLSFCAILGIAVVYPAFEKLFVKPLDKMADKLDRKRQIVKRQIMKTLVIVLGNFWGSVSVSLVTLPIIMYQYYQVPVYSIFLNIIVVPLMSLLLLCALLVAIVGLISLPLATFFMGTVHYILAIYTYLCNVFDNLQGNIWVTGRPELTDCVMFYVVLAVFVALVSMKKVRKKKHENSNILYAIIVGIALMILIPQSEDELIIRVIDVGQGDGIYVSYNGENYLFDGGSTDVKNVGKQRIFPCLRSNGVTSLDYVFISHADADHISGVLELFEMQDSTFVIKNLVLPDIEDRQSQIRYNELVSKAMELGINVIYVNRGDSYKAGDGKLVISCLHPCENYNYDSANDYSAVYNLSLNDFSMLFTGDVEESGEDEILQWFNEEQNKVDTSSTVLKVSHHGSKYSSTEEFLDAVSPKVAVISCGSDNYYGHPHKETLERLENIGAKIFVTSECGQITIRVQKDIKVYGMLQRKDN